jgi:hypothetical protein
MGTTSAPLTEAAFDAVYWAHQPPAIQALAQIQDFTQRSTQAMTLATQGYTIDVPIMVWGWDPYLVMSQRIAYGYTWVPSALMGPITLAPGVSQPGAAAYDPNNPASGSIKVSLNPADYPPYNPPPVPVVPVPATSLVGVTLGSGFWQAIGNMLPNGTSLANGQSYADPDGRGEFTFHEAVNGFTGHTTIWFTQP